MYHCKPKFYYIKVGCKGMYITRICLHDGEVVLVITGRSKVVLLLCFIVMFLDVNVGFGAHAVFLGALALCLGLGSWVATFWERVVHSVKE